MPGYSSPAQLEVFLEQRPTRPYVEAGLLEARQDSTMSLHADGTHAVEGDVREAGVAALPHEDQVRLRVQAKGDRPLLVYVLVEHQSNPDAYATALHEYIGRIWARWRTGSAALVFADVASGVDFGTND